MPVLTHIIQRSIMIKTPVDQKGSALNVFDIITQEQKIVFVIINDHDLHRR
jgi:hypothetical protein